MSKNKKMRVITWCDGARPRINIQMVSHSRKGFMVFCDWWVIDKGTSQGASESDCCTCRRQVKGKNRGLRFLGGGMKLRACDRITGEGLRA